ncbi:MAG TPA: hypothetical protein VK191_07695 [Symbiobacteriaceae bacterium]|nr:hypothetical protein [Symbiobacteriaceae bacterium]
MAEDERLDEAEEGAVAPEESVERAPEQAAEGTLEQAVEEAPADSRAARRAPHPLWRLGKALLILALMAGAAWAGYEGLVYLAGPVLPGPVQSFDPQGIASLSYIGVHPLPGSGGEGVLITWTAQNLGAKSWSVGTHHWEPLYPDLPPLPLPRSIPSGGAAQMAVRLEVVNHPVVGWRLVGLKGPVQDGQIEVTISR